MKFFKKLKERLFKLNVDHKSVPSKEKDTIVDLKKTALDQKIVKENLQSRKKRQNLNKYIAGLDKSSSSFTRSIKELQSRHHKLDQNFFDDLEDILIMSDISLTLVDDIIDEIKREVQIENVSDIKLIGEIIVDKIFTIYTNQTIVDTLLNVKFGRKNVILITGVNGSGKTTTIAKLGYKLKNQGFNVLFIAGDTFRAGAVEQLSEWAKRLNIEIVKPKKVLADPASVVFDGLKVLKEKNYDVALIDTAGRLQNKVNLMNELAKINDIIKRQIEDGPHESLLVLDASTGQNGLSQAKHFKDVTPLTGIILTKMDGTSKGGIILTIKEQLELAVKMIGLGEQIDDLEEFDLDAFIYGMTKGLINEQK